MSVPLLAQEPMMTLVVTLRHVPIGRTPTGERNEVFFEGTATSPHWEGEWNVEGIDHITVGSNAIARIDVHTIIVDPSGDEVVTYRGNGRGGPRGVYEGVILETASQRLAWLNEAVAVGHGNLDGDQLTVELFLIEQ